MFIVTDLVSLTKFIFCYRIKMSAKVYFWSPTSELIGHSSMKLADGTYISHWPKEACSATRQECESWQPDDVAEDIRNEDGRQPIVIDVSISADGQKKIKSWWNDYKKSNYNFISNNCSTVVYQALKIVFPYLSVFDGKIRAWVPKAVEMVANGVRAGSAFFTAQRVKDIVEVAKAEAVRIAKGHSKIAGRYVSKKY